MIPFHRLSPIQNHIRRYLILNHLPNLPNLPNLPRIPDLLRPLSDLSNPATITRSVSRNLDIVVVITMYQPQCARICLLSPGDKTDRTAAFSPSSWFEDSRSGTVTYWPQCFERASSPPKLIRAISRCPIRIYHVRSRSRRTPRRSHRARGMIFDDMPPCCRKFHQGRV